MTTVDMPTTPKGLQPIDYLSEFLRSVDAIEQRFAAGVGPTDELEHAQDMYALFHYGNKELAERFPAAWDALNGYFNSEKKGMYAVGHLLMLRMLVDASDLLPLFVQRAYEELHAALYPPDAAFTRRDLDNVKMRAYYQGKQDATNEFAQGAREMLTKQRRANVTGRRRA